jgi:hypothetical protein
VPFYSCYATLKSAAAGSLTPLAPKSPARRQQATGASGHRNYCGYEVGREQLARSHTAAALQLGFPRWGDCSHRN